jgi:phosphate uptake regulator
MKRRIIQQHNSFTLTLPIKWVRGNELVRNDEVTLSEEDNKLIIEPGEVKKQIKQTEIKLKAATYNIYRSIIGGLYRGGYDEIKVKFDDPKIIPELQKTVDSLYGFEVLEMGETSCVIKTVFKEESAELKSHINKVINIIKTMQSILMNDISTKKHNSADELLQFRNNVLKQRDLIARTIVKQKLLDNKNFPYYTIAYNLWHIARNYYYLYRALPKSVQKEDIDLLKKINKEFELSFSKNPDLIERHREFAALLKAAQERIKKYKVNSIQSYSTTIISMIQSCNSLLLLLSS